MGEAKRIEIKPISRQDADRIVKALHYSGKVVNNAQLHFGVFLDGRCGGALQFGPSLDKSHLQGLVAGTGWNEFIELNRMALADWLPRNGESRALAVCFRLIRKKYPHLKWVVSFSDGTQCGDGIIYRAAGFALTQIKTNSTLWQLTDGRVVSNVGINTSGRAKKIMGMAPDENATGFLRRTGAIPLKGFQLRYLYFLDPTARDRLTVPILPYSAIEAAGACMYKGVSRVSSVASDTPPDQGGEGGATPTETLIKAPHA